MIPSANEGVEHPGLSLLLGVKMYDHTGKLAVSTGEIHSCPRTQQVPLRCRSTTNGCVCACKTDGMSTAAPFLRATNGK